MLNERCCVADYLNGRVGLILSQCCMGVKGSQLQKKKKKKRKKVDSLHVPAIKHRVLKFGQFRENF